ncbi:Protein of unknown function [Gryllus bimaculatus]|nr:Protein of unknown function [Gryllus bimaculatus]
MLLFGEFTSPPPPISIPPSLLPPGLAVEKPLSNGVQQGRRAAHDHLANIAMLRGHSLGPEKSNSLQRKEEENKTILESDGINCGYPKGWIRLKILLATAARAVMKRAASVPSDSGASLPKEARIGATRGEQAAAHAAHAAAPGQAGYPPSSCARSPLNATAPALPRGADGSTSTSNSIASNDGRSANRSPTPTHSAFSSSSKTVSWIDSILAFSSTSIHTFMLTFSLAFGLAFTLAFSLAFSQVFGLTFCLAYSLTYISVFSLALSVVFSLIYSRTFRFVLIPAKRPLQSDFCPAHQNSFLHRLYFLPI